MLKLDSYSDLTRMWCKVMCFIFSSPLAETSLNLLQIARNEVAEADSKISSSWCFVISAAKLHKAK